MLEPPGLLFQGSPSLWMPAGSESFRVSTLSGSFGCLSTWELGSLRNSLVQKSGSSGARLTRQPWSFGPWKPTRKPGWAFISICLETGLWFDKISSSLRCFCETFQIPQISIFLQNSVSVSDFQPALLETNTCTCLPSYRTWSLFLYSTSSAQLALSISQNVSRLQIRKPLLFVLMTNTLIIFVFVSVGCKLATAFCSCKYYQVPALKNACWQTASHKIPV